uniref:helix-turn-helix domain-containing protein n=1 Tax=Marinobacter subterrani TaxID=1658765 RepID=UPI000A5BB35F|nr:helix-turn-helix domain-containing protein [Marinobacter subterrani]
MFAEATCDGGEITANDLPEECVPDRMPPLENDLAASDSESTPLLNALHANHWNISEVARQFGVSRPTVYRWMGQQGITLPRFLSRGDASGR